MSQGKHIICICIWGLFIISGYDGFAQLITVKQDGTGDFMQIQPAVDAAGNGDTVLVWPGEYVENVIIEDKYITLASLFLTTNNESYIDSTIINGNQTGSGVAILQGLDTTSLIGFSITNGSGYPVYSDIITGGGICVYESYALIQGNEVYNNMAPDGGGGICIWGSQALIDSCYAYNNFSSFGAGGIGCRYESHVCLSGSKICFNHAYGPGGGVAVTSGSELVFDSTNRCNMYLNFASLGCDIHNALSEVGKVYVDTFTVISPDSYFVSSIGNFGYQQYDIEVDVLASKIIPYDGDLYVNPVTGNDDNTGTQPDLALKTIAFANAKIKIDSINKNTIHLGAGIYSDSANNEKFPLNIRPFVHVKGAGRDKTILDGMFKTYMIRGNNEISHYSFSNMSMQRGTMVDYDNTFSNTNLFGFIYWENNSIIFDSIRFRNGIGEPGRAGLVINGTKNTTISNCVFEEIKGLEAFDVSLFDGDTAYIFNCTFNHNKPDENNPDWHYGKALRVHGGYDEDDPFVAVIQNCLFNDNDQNAFLATMGKIYMINNTFVNNSQESIGLSAINIWGTRGYMYNCISNNNGDSPFMIWELDDVASNFNVYNSCIEGGQTSFNIDQVSTLIYDETNIDTDPLFLGTPEYPYNLSSASPCINAGTLDIPEWIELYPYDLAGNPRVHNGYIDMGAYEWNPTVSVKEAPLVSTKQKALSAAPNPFSASTSITIDLANKANAYIDIYNSQGRHVRHYNLFTQSDRTLQWDGKDKSGRDCNSGAYFIIMTKDNMVLDELKLLKY